MEKIKYTNNKNKLIEQKTLEGLILTEEAIQDDGDYLIFLTKEEWLDSYVRPERDKLLRESDIYMLEDWSDVLKVKGKHNEMKQYRQSLRDLPENITGSDFKWPVFPEGIND